VNSDSGILEFDKQQAALLLQISKHGHAFRLTFLKIYINMGRERT